MAPIRSRCLPALLIAVAIAAVPAAVSAGTTKCIEDPMNTLSAILREADDSDVFVRVDKQYAYGDDSKQYDELCSAYEKSSDDRKKQVKIVKVNGDDTDGGDGVAKELGADDEDTWPTYFLIKKGTKNSDFPQSVKAYEEEDRSSDKLAEFLHRETGATIGSFVYSLGMMDTLASKFVDAGKEDARYGEIQRRAIAFGSKIMAIMIKFRADNDLKMVADLYVKAFFKILESDDYAQKQTDRIKKLMEKDNSMSNAKREQMSQKLHILSKFTEPKELTDAENRSLLINIGMNVVLFVAFVVTLLQMIFGSGEEAEKEPVDAEAVEEAEDEEVDEKED
mmetsp:Transcript_21701/g.47299  ORF Transcript_21701/g.47299 Transcript_21701/m.47299 type:complete len:336 (-) Transcript_21701:127-1134(-)